MPAVPDAVEVVVVGAGQAGLSISYELTRAGIEHVALERGQVGQTWLSRWDSFCLVIPNWTIKLPGGDYQGDDPDQFMPRDEIVAYLARYAASFGVPVHTGVEVHGVELAPEGGFRVRTSAGAVSARHVVLASGGYQRPHRPTAASAFPDSVVALDADGYTNPEALPPGPVLVVGSGQTGCQLAEELVESGRDVFLACGRAPWLPRRIGDRDLFAWMADTGIMDATVADLPDPSARLIATPLASGHDGGHDLHYRTLQASGVTLLGHLIGVDDNTARFASDLAESVTFGDARYAEVCTLIREWCAACRATRPPAAPALRRTRPGAARARKPGSGDFHHGVPPGLRELGPGPGGL